MVCNAGRVFFCCWAFVNILHSWAFEVISQRWRLVHLAAYSLVDNRFYATDTSSTLGTLFQFLTIHTTGLGKRGNVETQTIFIVSWNGIKCKAYLGHLGCTPQFQIMSLHRHLGYRMLHFSVWFIRYCGILWGYFILWDSGIVRYRYCGIQILWESDIVRFRYCGRLDLRFSSHAFTCQCNEGTNATSWLPLPTYLQFVLIFPRFYQ